MTATSWTERSESSPNKGLDLPAEVLTPAEVDAIIGQCSARAATGIRNRALLTLLYRSGLRVSEALSLKPSDVNVDARTIRVLNGKGGKTTTRSFHPTATDSLARWLDTRKQLGLRNGPLFCTSRAARCIRSTSATCFTAWRPRPEWTSAFTRTASATRSPWSSRKPERR